MTFNSRPFEWDQQTHLDHKLEPQEVIDGGFSWCRTSVTANLSFSRSSDGHKWIQSGLKDIQSLQMGSPPWRRMQGLQIYGRPREGTPLVFLHMISQYWTICRGTCTTVITTYSNIEYRVPITHNLSQHNQWRGRLLSSGRVSTFLSFTKKWYTGKDEKIKISDPMDGTGSDNNELAIMYLGHSRYSPWEIFGLVFLHTETSAKLYCNWRYSVKFQLI